MPQQEVPEALSYRSLPIARYASGMFSMRSFSSAALLFDLSLTAVVISFGLLFDHLVQAPPAARQLHYAQHQQAASPPAALPRFTPRRSS